MDKEAWEEHKKRNYHIIRFPNWAENYNVSCNNLVYNKVRFATTQHLIDYEEAQKNCIEDRKEYKKQIRKFNNKHKQPYIKPETYKQFININN